MEPFTASLPNKRRRWSRSQDQVTHFVDDHQSDCRYFNAESIHKNPNYMPTDLNADAVRSSWLINPKWISNRDHLLIDPSALYGTCEKNEIDNIQQQLVAVKRRLVPAAERSARKLDHDHYPTSITDHKSRLRYIFEQARRVCNPYEVLGEGRNCGLNQYLFMNRSAIKLANVDALIGFYLTKMVSCAINDRCTFKFCDLCGAPGGFSEYILWRLRHPVSQPNASFCRGYGMSLVGANEHGCGIPWKLKDKNTQENIFCNDEAAETCQYYKVCNGVDGTGDIHNWENVVSLQQTIYNDDTALCHIDVSSAEKGKVHLVLADGGFDAQRDVENQEEVAQKLVACEAAAALSLLCTGGTLVIKLFGFQTSIVRSMMRHFYFSFDHIIALKPISSRPASTERYVVCVGFRGNPVGWTGHRWISDLYLGRLCAIATYKSDVDYNDKESALFTYLDEFDRDLSSLNLKANFAILSQMERSCLSASQGGCTDAEDDPDFEVSCVNVLLYRIAWCLDH